MTEILILCVLLLLSGFFSGSETALVALSLARAESLAKEGRHGSGPLLRLKRDPSQMLITILIGNNIVNIAASAIATVLATRYLGDIGPGIAVGALTILILVFGEITPKSLATRYSERISLVVAPLIYGFMRLIYPLVWLFGRFTDWVHRRSGVAGDPIVTETELITMVEHGETEGTFEAEERRMIQRVLTFADLQADDVMTPRRKVFRLNGRLPIRDVLDQIMDQVYTRIPLFDVDPDEIKWIVHLRDVVEAVTADKLDLPLKEIASEPIFVPENQHLDELIVMLRQRKQHLAVVVDEHGLMLGVVTLEDLVEELVGEIYDELDEPEDEYMMLAEGRILVGGATELRVVERYFDMELPGKPTDTVSWWILNHAERIPKVEERFRLDGLDVVVQAASLRRIHQVVLSRVKTEAPADAATE